jgi:hypothetical protein
MDEHENQSDAKTFGERGFKAILEPALDRTDGRRRQDEVVDLAHRLGICPQSPQATCAPQRPNSWA